MEESQDSSFQEKAMEILESGNKKCKWCERSFKDEKLYQKHILHQTCIKPNYRTNCIVCEAMFETKKELELHQLTMEHFAKVCNMDSSVDYKWKKNNTSNIKKNDENFKIQYQDDTVEAFEIAESTHQNIIPPNTSANPNINSANPNINITNESQINTSQDRNNVVKGNNAIMEKRAKIMNHLVKLRGNERSMETFIGILSKLSPDDFDGLEKAIALHSELSPEEKGLFIRGLKQFAVKLATLFKSGQKQFNGIAISDILSKIMNR